MGLQTPQRVEPNPEPPRLRSGQNWLVVNDSGGARCASLNRQLHVQLSTLKPVVSEIRGEPSCLTAVNAIGGQPRTGTTFDSASTCDPHVDFTRKEREPVSTLQSSHSTLQIADHTLSLHLDRMQHFTSMLIHTANLSRYSEITLQDVPTLKYTLRLLVDNEEKELQRMDNRTWEPAQPLYAYVSLMSALTKICVHVEVHLRHPRCALSFK